MVLAVRLTALIILVTEKNIDIYIYVLFGESATLIGSNKRHGFGME